MGTNSKIGTQTSARPEVTGRRLPSAILKKEFPMQPAIRLVSRLYYKG